MSNLSPQQTITDISDGLQEIDTEAKFVDEKPPHLNKKTSSSVFTVKAPLKYQALLCNPDFWPANTYVNRYYQSCINRPHNFAPTTVTTETT